MENKIKNRYNRIAQVYDILEWPMEMMVSGWRERLMSGAQGKVLEVGVGTGKNIPYYPDDADVTGIDFSEKMIEKAKKKSNERDNVKVLLMDAEKMLFEDNLFDTVITSCVFCSVPDPVRGLEEIRRVCKSGGKILMLEHVRSDKKIVGKMMDVINTIPLHIYGANINRRTYDNLLKAGFRKDDIRVECLWSDIVLLFYITNYKP
ncbi:MAG: class I SAM-dependent methyltransferase [Bacteroidales bacterium]